MVEDFADLFGPGHVPGYLSGEDIDAIKLLCEKINPHGTLVEVGCFLGKSSVEWASNLPHCKIICIDSFNSPYSILKKLIENTHHKLPVEPNNQQELFEYYTKNFKNIRVVKGFFDENFGYPGKVDCVFEDSTHEGSYLSYALPFWWKHINRGGLLCGHDYTLQQVQTAVDLFAAVYDLKVNTFDNGSSIWYIKK